MRLFVGIGTILIVFGNIFNDLFFAVVDIIGQGLFVEDVDAVLKLSDDVVGVLVGEVRHLVVILSENFLGLDHEAKEVLVYFIGGRLLNDGEMGV